MCSSDLFAGRLPGEAANPAGGGEYGRSASIRTRDGRRGPALAERIRTGTAPRNDQTGHDEAVAPFGAVPGHGTGARFGGAANLDAFTERRRITPRGEIPADPF